MPAAHLGIANRGRCLGGCRGRHHPPPGKVAAFVTELNPRYDRVGPRANTGSHNDHLRVLIANERLDRLDLLATVVEGLGHTVVERSIDVNEVAEATARLRPDVALVGLGKSSEHALNM